MALTLIALQASAWLAFSFVAVRAAHRTTVAWSREVAEQHSARLLAAMDPVDAAEARRLAERTLIAADRLRASRASLEGTAVRPMLSDAMNEAVQLELDDLRSLGVREHFLADVSFGRFALPWRHHREGDFEETTILTFEGGLFERRWNTPPRGRRRTLTADNGRPRVIDLPTDVERWSGQGAWRCLTFVRRVGASGSGTLEGQCPGCGAPLVLNAVETCAACDATVLRADHDWVLTNVTRVELLGRRDQTVPGWTTLRDLDPELTRIAVEERAQVLFLRHLASSRVGDAFVGDVQIGSSAVVAAVGGVHDDVVLVEVCWSGGTYEREKGGRIRQGRGHAARTWMLLRRRAGVRSNPSQTLTTAHCPSCHGPRRLLDLGRCPWCGAQRDDPERTWVLEDLRTEDRQAVQDHVMAWSMSDRRAAETAVPDLRGWCHRRIDGFVERPVSVDVVESTWPAPPDLRGVPFREE
ncbi:MAG: hypothetical protein H6738_01650 [Alphaproteobacteria bacterium]|nr:hypothetical protein [Alphaproteobacteria bacterium]MCB9695472.1 hypothetical protein [Alphaproteobacteria bacterium]